MTRFTDRLRSLRNLFATERDPFDVGPDLDGPDSPFDASKGWVEVDPAALAAEPSDDELTKLVRSIFGDAAPGFDQDGDECTVPGCRHTFSEDDVDNLGHDLAELFLQRQITRGEWDGFDVMMPGWDPALPTPAANYRRLARFVFGNVMGLTSERDGEHTQDANCAACVAVFGPVGGWADYMRVGEDVDAELNVMPTSVTQVDGDDLTDYDGPFGGAVYGGPPGTPAPGQDGYEGNWRPLGHITEHGFVPLDGVNLSPESVKRIEDGLFGKLGKSPKPFDDDFDRLLGNDEPGA